MFFNYFGNSDAVVNSVRLALKKMPDSYNNYPNMWCELLEQMQNGWGSTRSLYDFMINGLSQKYLLKYYDEQALLDMWIENFAHKQYNDETEYPEYLSEYMVAELAELVTEGLYGEDLYDLDEEIRKGERAQKARQKRLGKNIKIQV